MSLRVWLPLNGSLENQGLDNITVTNNGATVDNNGKIGKCYSFDGNHYIDTQFKENFGTGDFSIACWIKITQVSGKTYQCIIGNKSAAAVSVGCALYWNQNQKKFLWSTADGTGATEIWSVDTFDTLVYNQWHHIVMIRNNNDSKKGYFYFDGIRKEITSIPSIRNISSTTSLKIGAVTPLSSTYYYTGYINDVRIYDHALSSQEVKKISQGLVLHYLLNRNGWGQENLLLNTYFDSRYTQSTGWDTTKNGTLLANSWGGYNSGVSNQGTVYHAHLKEVNNEYVYEYIKTASESWLGIAQNGLQSKLVAGNTYTFSWEQYCVEGNNYSDGGLYYYKTGASSAGFYIGFFRGNSGRVLNKWQKYTYTFVAPTNGDYSKNMSWYIYGTSGGNGKMYIRHLKLEEGSIATPWCPNSSDTLADTLGLNNNIEYDASGYKNNGTKIGTFNYDNDTPKYNVSTNFNGTDNCIQLGNISSLLQDVFTINLWFKKDSLGSKNYETLFGGPGGFEMDTRSGNSQTLSLYMASTRGGNAYSPFNFGEWYMVTMVNNGVNELYYINGILVKTIQKKSMPSGNYFIGAWYISTSQNYKGLISDFRIYATALSAEDVLSLYQNEAVIEADGTIRGKIR